MRAIGLVWVVAAIGCGGAGTQQPEASPPAPVEGAPAVETDGAAAADEAGEADGSHLVARNFAVAPGKFAEINLELAAGVEVNAAFRADGDLQWNVHSHPEGGVAIHQEGTGSEGKISFVAATDGGYSYLWTNNGDAEVNIVISVELPAGARIVSWHPEEP